MTENAYEVSNMKCQESRLFQNIATCCDIPVFVLISLTATEWVLSDY